MFSADFLQNSLSMESVIWCLHDIIEIGITRGIDYAGNIFSGVYISANQIYLLFPFGRCRINVHICLHSSPAWRKVIQRGKRENGYQTWVLSLVSYKYHFVPTPFIDWGRNLPLIKTATITRCPKKFGLFDLM
jgi:hypothetical protein